MSELQAALETSIFVDIALPTEERRHQAKVVATLKEAARLVANPNIEAAHRAMRALMPREWEREPFPKAFAEIIIEAALTPGDTK